MALEASFGCSMKERGGIPLLQWDAWLRDGVPHGITTRHGGSSRPPYDALNLGDHVGDSRGAVEANRARLRAALGDMRRPLVTARQVHGGRAYTVVDKPDPSDEPPEADALVTRRDDVYLALMFADCVPVLFYDPFQRAVGVAHAGWRGLRAGVLENAVSAMQDAFGTDPARLEAAVGPHIGVCCYEIGPEVAEAFADVRRAVREDREGRRTLSLSRVVRSRLAGAGLAAENVSISSPCTSCFHEMYFSHRASGGPTGRFAAAIGLDSSGGPPVEPLAGETQGVASWEEERPARVFDIGRGF